MFNFLYFLYDILIPRFIEEWCIVTIEEDGSDTVGCDIVMPLDAYDEEFDDYPRNIALVASFTWLGFSFFPKLVNNDIFDFDEVKEHFEK